MDTVQHDRGMKHRLCRSCGQDSELISSVCACVRARVCVFETNDCVRSRSKTLEAPLAIQLVVIFFRLIAL